MPGIKFFRSGGQFLDEIEIALDLIAVAVEQERRMISVFFQDGPDFPPEEIITPLIRQRILSPHRHFYLKIYARLVGCTEGCIRRAP